MFQKIYSQINSQTNFLLAENSGNTLEVKLSPKESTSKLAVSDNDEELNVESNHVTTCDTNKLDGNIDQVDGDVDNCKFCLFKFCLFKCCY